MKVKDIGRKAKRSAPWIEMVVGETIYLQVGTPGSCTRVALWGSDGTAKGTIPILATP